MCLIEWMAVSSNSCKPFKSLLKTRVALITNCSYLFLPYIYIQTCLSYPIYLKMINLNLFFKYLQVNLFIIWDGLPFHKYKVGSFTVFILLKWEDKEKIQLTSVLSKNMGWKDQTLFQPPGNCCSWEYKCNINITEKN